MDDFLYILKLQLEGRLSDEQITDQIAEYHFIFHNIGPVMFCGCSRYPLQVFHCDYAGLL